MDKGVVNIRSKGYEHGTFFETDTLAKNLSVGGTWDHFLRMPRAHLADLPGRFVPAPEWKPLCKFLVIPVRVLFLILPLPVIVMTLNGWFQDARSLFGSMFPSR